MNFHELYSFIESQKWRGDMPEYCHICGAKFQPEGEMPEFVFYDVLIPAPPKTEDKIWTIVQNIINQRKTDGDKRNPQEIIDVLLNGNGDFPGWLKWPRGIWGHICDACHSSLKQSGYNLMGQRYAFGRNQEKLGEA